MEIFDNDLREHLEYLEEDNMLCFKCELNEVESLKDTNCRECINALENQEL